MYENVKQIECALMSVSIRRLNYPRIFPLLLILGFLIFACESPTDVEIGDSPERELESKPAIQIPEGFHVELYTNEVELPTSIRFPPDGSDRMFVNELQSGKILIFENGEKREHPFAEVNTNVTGGFPVAGEIGLLGLTFDPDYEKNGYVYATYARKYMERFTAKVVRFTDLGNAGSDKVHLLSDLPSAEGHQIQNLVFGPDEMLYVSVGDAYVESNVQNLDEFHGKILRMTRDGEIPEDNPFGDDSYIYAYGFRNTYDLVFTDDGQLLSTDNGPVGYDEFNVILPGENYGWDDRYTVGVTGDPELADPVHVWEQTTSPTGMHIYRGDQFPEKYRGKLFQVLFGSTHTEGPHPIAKRVQVVHTEGEGLEMSVEFEDFAVFDFGQVINNPLDITEGPDGSLYVSDIFQGKIYRIWYEP